MGQFSYICKKSRKALHAGDPCYIFYLENGQVKEYMFGNYDTYGRVSGLQWKKNWSEAVNMHFSEDKSCGFAAILAPKELKDKFYEVIKTFLKQEKFGITQQEIDKNAVKLQNTWENLGLKGTNPYTDHYSSEADGNAYDVLPLNECLPTVKDWVKDRVKEKEKYWEELLSAKEKADNGEYDMSGYYAGIYRDLAYGNFSFECNVFNIDDYDSESIPEDIEGWWAIMVDMHN